MPIQKILFLVACIFAGSRLFAAENPVSLSAENFVCGRQDFGETRADASVDGNALRIAGKTFSRGIGTHATSMIPLDVPAAAKTFSGAVGIDDEVAGAGDGAEFRVLSGSEVLWSSGAMKPGVPAKKFRIEIPVGTRKLYLLALAGKSNNFDHADWVNLAWENGARKNFAPRSREFSGKDFGIRANVETDQSTAFRAALNALRANGGGTLELQKGVYHFFSAGALAMSFWVSNHDQQEIQPVSLPLADLRDTTIRGNGSTFVFHGKCLPVLLTDCENITLDGIRIDLARPFYSEAKVLGFSGGRTLISIDKKTFPYEIRNGRLVFVGENFPEQGVQGVIAFREKTKNIVANTSDIVFSGGAEKISGGKLALHHDFSRDGDGVAVGDTLTLRTWARPHPACVLYRAKNSTLRDVAFHSGMGMALLAQRSENITITGTQNAAALTSGSFPRAKTNRVYSASADATHFSNVAGKVVVENSFFETMMDDAINVHSTCLDIAEIVAPDTLKCRYRHAQSVGFETFLAGETLRFIAGTTLENGARAKVENVRRISPTEVLIQLDGNVPAGVKRGDAVENADFQPEVVFRRNLVCNNRARGALFTTSRKVLVENNVFRNVAGSAILLAGDAQGWYESGACENVVIRKNLFENNLTSRFQFTNAIISIYPEVRNLTAQKKFYHRNISIENNEFRTFDVPLLFAISAEKIRFAKNKIFYNDDFKGWRQKPFQFKRCAEISVCGNAVAPVGKTHLRPQAWTLDDCRIEQMPANEIRFSSAK